jgi:hypothetical protein
METLAKLVTKMAGETVSEMPTVQTNAFAIGQPVYAEPPMAYAVPVGIDGVSVDLSPSAPPKQFY